MNNHAHMLIKVGNVKEMSKYMQRLNSKYALYYNKKFERVGYVFRDRFKSEAILSEIQFYTCIKYIFDNPVKAGICSKPEEYPYSNYKKVPSHLIDEDKYTFSDIEEDKEKEYLKVIKEYEDIDLKIKNINDYNDKQIQVIKLLKNKYKLSFRKIAKELKIGRETVRFLYNK